MAKASRSVPRADTCSNPAIAAAAAEIHGLMNSRPRNPTIDELAAVIAKACIGNVLDRNEDLAKWTAVVDAWLDVDPARLENDHPQHAEAHAVFEALCAASTAIWAKPVRSFADVVLRFGVAGYWNATGLLDHLVYNDDVIARCEARGFDEAGLAYLMRGLMDLTGIEFDADGRLRSEGGVS
jgi:hypothetical protein